MEDNARFCFERTEGDVAVLVDDDGISHNVPLTALAPDGRVGDLLVFTDGAYRTDADATAARRRRVLDLQNRLRGKR